MLHDRCGIISPDFNAGGLENFLRRFGGVMNPFVRQATQLWAILPHVLALRIELLALTKRIENPKIRSGISAAASTPLPSEGVLGEISVDQRIPEPAGAFDPGEKQILNEERSDDHADAVMHPTRGP
jgi:hypothetical protein